MPQTHFGKSFQITAPILKTHTVPSKRMSISMTSLICSCTDLGNVPMVVNGPDASQSFAISLQYQSKPLTITASSVFLKPGCG